MVRVLPLVVALLSAPACAATPAPDVPVLEEGGSAGKLAPDFTVVDHLGQTLVLSELRKAGPVIVLFYRGHW